MIEPKDIENFIKIAGDLKTLTTKVQKDNQDKSKDLKDACLLLEAYKKVDVKPQEELLKYKNRYNKGHCPQKKIQLSDIEFDEEKIRKLLSSQVRKKRHRYNDGDSGYKSVDTLLINLRTTMADVVIAKAMKKPLLPLLPKKENNSSEKEN